MWKIVACAAVVLLGAGCGWQVGRRYGLRVRQLEKCDLFLRRMEAYLSLERLTTREIFEHLADSEALRELVFLERTAGGLSEDVRFPGVWAQALKEAGPRLALNPEDYRPLVQLGDLVGAYDAATQQNGLETVRSLLEERLEDARRELHKNGRLARSLGTLAGVAAAVLIL